MKNRKDTWFGLFLLTPLLVFGWIFVTPNSPITWFAAIFSTVIILSIWTIMILTSKGFNHEESGKASPEDKR